MSSSPDTKPDIAPMPVAAPGSPEKKTRLGEFETFSKILSNIGGLLVPIAIGFFAYSYNTRDANRTHTEKMVETALSDNFLRMSEEDRTKIVQAVRAEGTDQPTIDMLFRLSKAVPVLRDAIANAGQQTLVVAEKSKDNAVKQEAQSVLNSQYNVVIDSYLDQTSAQRAADAANAKFQKAGSNLRAEALPPPSNSRYWGVYVGIGLNLADARARVEDVKKQGYGAAYFVKN